ncbi:MAG: VWA domain-containing protein [Chloroflexota bacterium]
MAQREPEKNPELLDVPFNRLNQYDIDQIRDEVRKLAAKLRSRASMRQRKHRTGQFDPRKTIRSNMRYGGVPIEIHHRKKHKKPKLVLICDLSTSMRYMVEFLMTLVYEMQDHVQKTSSFIFISDMVDVTMDLEQMDSQDAAAPFGARAAEEEASVEAPGSGQLRGEAGKPVGGRYKENGETVLLHPGKQGSPNVEVHRA